MGQQLKTMIPFINKQNKVNQQKQCRICLQTQDQDNLIHPCGCQGSSGHVHINCITQWIKRILDQRKQQYNSIKCQICHKDIYFQYRKHLQCVTNITACKKIKKSPYIFIIMVILIIITFGSLVYLCFLFNNLLQYQQTFSGRIKYIIYLLLMCGLSILIIVMIILFFKLFFVQLKKDIDNIQEYAKRRQNQTTANFKNKIIPEEIIDLY